MDNGQKMVKSGKGQLKWQKIEEKGSNIVSKRNFKREKWVKKGRKGVKIG